MTPMTRRYAEMNAQILKIVSRGTVVASEAGSNLQSCAFPQVCVLPSGRWICGFRAARLKTVMEGQQALIAHSDDEGRSWSQPVGPFAPPMVGGKPGHFRVVAATALGGRNVLATLYWVDASRAVPFFNEETEGLLDSRIFLAWSEDDGDSWTQPQLVDTAPFDCPTPITGPVLLLANGDLACQFELNKTYDDPLPWRHASVLMFSKDGGRSWGEPTLTSSDPENQIFYWDQRPSVLPDGSMLNLFWTFDRANAVYCDIHARRSVDNGRTWSEMWSTGVPGQPAPPVVLPHGRLGMVYVDRTDSPAIKMRISADGGRSWPEASELVIDNPSILNQTIAKRDVRDALSEMSKFSIGLPATATTHDGDVLVVYYSGASVDQTDIKWVRVSASADDASAGCQSAGNTERSRAGGSSKTSRHVGT